jgi:hypothetical protein
MKKIKWRKANWKNPLDAHGDSYDELLGYYWRIKELDWEIFLELEKDSLGNTFWVPVISFGKNFEFTKMNDISFEDLEDAKEFCQEWVLTFLGKAANLLQNL